MILERGNMWDVFGKTDVFIITTNPVITKLGKGVMGRGIAKEAADKYPELPYELAGAIYHSPRKYCSAFALVEGQVMGYFMVKDHWAEPAKLDIISESTDELLAWVKYGAQYKPDCRFDLNFPGIGNGKLSREDVLPIIEKLPDNVHVWEYGV